MRKNGLNTAAIILLLMQLALSAYSFIIIKRLFENQLQAKMLDEDQLYLYISFAVSFLVSLILVFFIYRQKAQVRQEEQHFEMKSVELSKNEQRRLDKKQAQLKQEELEKKKLLLEKLRSGLANDTELDLFTEKVLINISKAYDIMQGVFFVKDLKDKVFRKHGAYAYYSEDELREFTEEVGLSGQVATNKKLLNITNIPDKYLTVLSGLGKSAQANLLIFPVLNNNETIGVIELASFVKFDSYTEAIFMEFSIEVGELLAKLIAIP